MVESLQSLLSPNQFFSGGRVLGLIGIVAVWFREVPKTFFNWAKQFFVTTLSFDSRDELLFSTLVEYMHEKDVLRRINNFTVRKVRQGPEYQTLQDELQQGGKPQA